MPSTLQWVNAGLRVPLFAFATISLGLSGHLRAETYNIARNNLGIAASAITLFFCILFAWPYLFIDSIFNVIPLLVFDFISFALMLSAAASLTNQRHVCHQRGYCAELRANIAFLYMSWIILLFIMVLELYHLFAQGMGAGSGSTGGGGFKGRTRFNTGHYNDNTAAAYTKPEYETSQPANNNATARSSVSAPSVNQPAAAADHQQTTVGGTYPAQA